jgi:hypothetical protein
MGKQRIGAIFATVIIALSISDFLAGDDTRQVRLTGFGRGTKRLETVDGSWQEIRFSGEVSFDLKCRPVQQTGDVISFDILEKHGTYLFSFEAEYQTEGLHETIAQTVEAGITIVGGGGYLIYSLSEKRIADLEFPIPQKPGLDPEKDAWVSGLPGAVLRSNRSAGAGASTKGCPSWSAVAARAAGKTAARTATAMETASIALAYMRRLEVTIFLLPRNP